MEIPCSPRERLGFTHMLQLVAVSLALHGLALRAAAPPRAGRGAVACAPFRSDEQYDYFRRTQRLQLALPKPLGAVLEEPESGAPGLVVVGLQEGGSALASGKLRKGDRLLGCGDVDLAAASFDDAMAALAAAADELELTVERGVVVRKERVPATLKIRPRGGEVIEGDVPPGAILRNCVVDAGVDLYPDMMAKMKQCGGAGQCAPARPPRGATRPPHRPRRRRGGRSAPLTLASPPPGARRAGWRCSRAMTTSRPRRLSSSRKAPRSHRATASRAKPSSTAM